jgi:hypothetical protein
MVNSVNRRFQIAAQLLERKPMDGFLVKLLPPVIPPQHCRPPLLANPGRAATVLLDAHEKRRQPQFHIGRPRVERELRSSKLLVLPLH